MSGSLEIFGRYTGNGRLNLQMDLGNGKTIALLLECHFRFGSMLLTAKPPCPRIIDKAIEKQPAWAAAISSSGLVPLSRSNRVLYE